MWFHIPKGECRLLINSTVVSPADIVSASDIASATDTPFNLIDALENFSMDWFTPAQLIVIIAVVFIILMLALEFLRSRYALTVTKKFVTLERLPKAFDGTKIAVISDLHQMRFGESNSELAKRIKREEPDYIFFVGDMGDSNKFNVDAFYDLLESLGDKIPIITVPGNHDLRLGGGTLHKNFVREVERSGAVILSNTSAEMVSGGKKLYIYGFCQPLAQDAELPPRKWKFADVSEEDVENLLGKCPTDAPVILLAHDPNPFHCYSAWGADLVLSGHIHGGSIRLPFVGGLFGPEMPALPKYTAGIYTDDDTQMFVTRGLASAIPRFLNPPEIAILTLTRPDSELLQQPAEPFVVMPSFSLKEDEEETVAAGTTDSKPAITEGSKKDKKETGSSKSGKAENSTGKKSGIGKPSGNPVIDRLKSTFSSFGDWFKSESRSLKELLNERLNQLNDFIALMIGKKRSKYSRIADERKQRSTYVAPNQKKKKQPKKRYRK